MTLLREEDGVAFPFIERSRLFGPTEQDNEDPMQEVFRTEPPPGVCEVRAGCIGRGHAGKTSLFRAMQEGPVGDFFPSGLHVDVGDPREVAQMIREGEETQRILQESGLPPTLIPSQIRYYLYDGDCQRVVYKMREVIGQVLTHTMPNSAPEQQERYDDYLKSLINTHVLWAVVPCLPPNPSSRDQRRYSHDLRITSAFLREALRLRTLQYPVAVALVLSKIDTLFSDVEEARAGLNNDTLRSSLGPLVHLVETSTHVSDAIIVPVSAFGFGNAVLRPQEQEAAVPSVVEDPFGAEATWLLKEGTSPRPFNLDTLVVWTLLYGLLNQITPTSPDLGSTDRELCRMLREDLQTEGHWFQTLKVRREQG